MRKTTTKVNKLKPLFEESKIPENTTTAATAAAAAAAANMKQQIGINYRESDEKLYVPTLSGPDESLFPASIIRKVYSPKMRRFC